MLHIKKYVLKDILYFDIFKTYNIHIFAFFHFSTFFKFFMLLFSYSLFVYSFVISIRKFHYIHQKF